MGLPLAASRPCQALPGPAASGNCCASTRSHRSTGGAKATP